MGTPQHARVGFAIIMTLVVSPLPAPAQAVLDALVASVGPRVIALSDVRLARGLLLVDPGESIEATVGHLVDRTLMLIEVERFQEADPLEASVDQSLAALRQKVGSEAWLQVLARCGVDEAYVRALVEDNLRVDLYLRQRFTALSEPGDEDLRAAYDQRQSEAGGANFAPFETMRTTLHQELSATRFKTLVDQWLVELRTRGNVSIHSLPGEAGTGNR
jgi:hypothetical protein